SGRSIAVCIFVAAAPGRRSPGPATAEAAAWWRTSGVRPGRAAPAANSAMASAMHTSAATPARPAPRASLARRLFATVDIASLVCFRVLFGLLMFVEVWRDLPL